MKTDLSVLYHEVKKHIETVDFSKLWDGFRPLKFALYHGDECFFDGEYIPRTDEFLANTAILYHDEMIAIWDVNQELDSRILASKIIHEMFHGFQRLNGECRFPDDLDALYHYRYDDSHLSLKWQENCLIAELVEDFCVEAFEKLLAMRKYRYDRFYAEYHYEACVEQIEGTAEFVELNALRQLSEDLYLKKRDLMIKRITARESLIPIRIICYEIGALLLLLLSGSGIAYESGFAPVPFSESLIVDVREYIGPIELTMGKTICDHNERVGAVISEALSKNDVVFRGECGILGVNVYNAVYYDRYIISRYFVMYGEEKDPKVEYGDFLIETNAYKKMSVLYRL